MFVLAVNGFTDSASPADERAFAWVYQTLVPQFFFFFFANLARVLLLCIQLRLTSGIKAAVDCVHTSVDMGTEQH